MKKAILCAWVAASFAVVFSGCGADVKVDGAGQQQEQKKDTPPPPTVEEKTNTELRVSTGDPTQDNVLVIDPVAGANDYAHTWTFKPTETIQLTNGGYVLDTKGCGSSIPSVAFAWTEVDADGNVVDGTAWSLSTKVEAQAGKSYQFMAVLHDLSQCSRVVLKATVSKAQ